MTGLYIHVPFCLSKCPYCDFYSVKFDKDTAARYKNAVTRNLSEYHDVRFDTVYFGGGTPILLWQEICDILSAIGDRITSDAEITIEANPCCTSLESLYSLKSSGVNRISFGLQSGIDAELKALGRRHSASEGAKAVINADKAGFKNISADIMIGIPFQNDDSLLYTLSYLTDMPLTHISSYMLKIEPNTPFAKSVPVLPDDGKFSEYYLQVGRYLADKGFFQYEISNYSKPGYESRHNLKYWRCEEYIGIGPSAHSYYNGKRFAVGRNLDDFLNAPKQRCEITDEHPGGFEEWAMLKLRLSEGLDFKTARERYSISREEILNKCRKLPKELYNADNEHIRLTPDGFLVSNAIIGIITDI